MSFCPFFSNGFTPLLSKTQVISNSGVPKECSLMKVNEDFHLFDYDERWRLTMNSVGMHYG